MKIVKENLYQIENYEIQIDGKNVSIRNLVEFYKKNVEKVNLIEQLEKINKEI